MAENQLQIGTVEPPVSAPASQVAVAQLTETAEQVRVYQQLLGQRETQTVSAAVTGQDQFTVNANDVDLSFLGDEGTISGMTAAELKAKNAELQVTLHELQVALQQTVERATAEIVETVQQQTTQTAILDSNGNIALGMTSTESVQAMPIAINTQAYSVTDIRQMVVAEIEATLPPKTLDGFGFAVTGIQQQPAAAAPAIEYTPAMPAIEHTPAATAAPAQKTSIVAGAKQWLSNAASSVGNWLSNGRQAVANLASNANGALQNVVQNVLQRVQPSVATTTTAATTTAEQASKITQNVVADTPTITVDTSAAGPTSPLLYEEFDGADDDGEVMTVPFTISAGAGPVTTVPSAPDAAPVVQDNVVDSIDDSEPVTIAFSDFQRAA